MSDEMREDDLQPVTKREFRELGLSHGARFMAIEANLHRLNVGVARMQGDIAELRAEVVTREEFRAAFGQMMSGIDAQTRLLEDMRHRWAVQSGALVDQHKRLDEHEKRISALESRPH